MLSWFGCFVNQRFISNVEIHFKYALKSVTQGDNSQINWFIYRATRWCIETNSDFQCLVHLSGWRFYKLQLRGVCLLDFYGGATHVPLDKYFATQPPAKEYSPLWKMRDFEERILAELGESLHNEVDPL